LLQVRKNIGNLPPAVHGGISYALKKGMRKHSNDIIDFSTNINPYGPPAGTKKAINKAIITGYPDSSSYNLRLQLASKLNVKPENLLAGNGSTELIRLVATAFINPGDNVIVLRPSYGEYETAASIADAKIQYISALKNKDLRFPVENIINGINKYNPKLLFMGNPNNPTGQYFKLNEIKRILTANKNSLTVLDEAYIAFTPDAWESVNLLSYDNLIIIRSMTKDYSLAGLRLGYAIGNSRLIAELEKLLPPWNVSSVAQAAGIHVLKDDAFLIRSNNNINKARQYLLDALSAAGYKTVPSQTSFFMIKVGDAAWYKSNLLKRGILVRDCTSFGLPEYIRISPRSIPDCKKFINIITGIRK